MRMTLCYTSKGITLGILCLASRGILICWLSVSAYSMIVSVRKTKAMVFGVDRDVEENLKRILQSTAYELIGSMNTSILE